MIIDFLFGFGILIFVIIFFEILYFIKIEEKKINFLGYIFNFYIEFYYNNFLSFN